MPHKSKHKQQFRKQPAAPAAQPVSAAVPGTTPATTPMVKTAAATVRPATVKPRAGATPHSLAAIGPARYPFLTSEIKWIGIFAVIIIVFMAILKVILPLFIK